MVAPFVMPTFPIGCRGDFVQSLFMHQLLRNIAFTRVLGVLFARDIIVLLIFMTFAVAGARSLSFGYGSLPSSYTTFAD